MASEPIAGTLAKLAALLRPSRRRDLSGPVAPTLASLGVSLPGLSPQPAGEPVIDLGYVDLAMLREVREAMRHGG